MGTWSYGSREVWEGEMMRKVGKEEEGRGRRWGGGVVCEGEMMRKVGEERRRDGGGGVVQVEGCC